MEKTSSFLIKKFDNKNDLDNVFFVVNNFKDFYILDTFLSYVNIKQVFVYNNLKENIDVISNNKYKIINNSCCEYERCVCLSNCESFKIGDILNKYNSKNIVFFNEEGDKSSFKIWDSLNKYCNYIEIVSKNLYGCTRVLNWVKRNTDIELSVILPVFNVEKYLDKCINNLIANNSKYIEYIFVDDGSTDNSAQIIKKYASNYKNIKYVYKNNGGCASARELGLNLAKGRYVGFVDPDDFTDKRMFEDLLSAAMSGSYDVAHCGYNEYYNDIKLCKEKKEPFFDEKYSNGVYDKKEIIKLISGIDIGIWRGIYLKKFIENNNIHFFKELKRFDDLPFKCLIYLYAESVICLPKHYYYYRLNRPGQDVSCDGEKLFIHFEIFELLDEYFINKSEMINKEYQKVIRNTHSWALSKLSWNLKIKYKRLMRIANKKYK